MARDTVCIGEFGSGPEAGLAQSFLQEEGIEAFVAGEVSQSWAYGMGPYTQAVRLEVKAADAERARTLLSSIEGRVRDRVEREYLQADEPGETRPSLPRDDPADGNDDVVQDQRAAGADLPPLGREDEVPLESEGDANARRARAAAVLSLVLPPLLPYAYVLLLLSLSRSKRTTRTPRVRGWLLQALLFSVLLTVLYGAFFHLIR